MFARTVRSISLIQKNVKLFYRRFGAIRKYFQVVFILNFL